MSKTGKNERIKKKLKKKIQKKNQKKRKIIPGDLNVAWASRISL